MILAGTHLRDLVNDNITLTTRVYMSDKRFQGRVLSSIKTDIN